MTQLLTDKCSGLGNIDCQRILPQMSLGNQRRHRRCTWPLAEASVVVSVLVLVSLLALAQVQVMLVLVTVLACRLPTLDMQIYKTLQVDSKCHHH
jgi:uncharacterized metal-binding protein